MFDLQDFISFFSNEIFFQLEPAVFSVQPSIVDISFSDPIVRESVAKFIYETETGNHVVYRRMHPMFMVSFLEESYKHTFVTNLLGHLDMQRPQYEFLIAFLDSQKSIAKEFQTFLHSERFIFETANRAWTYMNGDLWSFLMAGFVPDFVEGPFWDHCSYETSNDIITCWSMFLLQQKN